MINFYPCLYDYVKDDFSIIAEFAVLFSEIGNLATYVFTGYDSELFSELGYQYYFERAKRPLKVLYYKYCEINVDWEDSDSIEAFLKHIAKVAYSRFGDNWERIYKTYFVDTYNPLNNYDMEQKRTPNLTHDTDIDRKSKVTTDTDGKTSIVPFNSTTPLEVSETEGGSTVEELLADNHVDSKTTETGTDTLTRKGNIGVMSTQDLINQELNLRRFDFIKRIFKDIDSVLLRDYWP